MPPQSHKRRRGHPRIHKHKTRGPNDPPSSASLQRRWGEAARRAQAAAEGTLSPDEAPVMVSSIYSFMPAHLNIPAGTPYTGMGSAEAHPGTFHGNLFSEDVVNLMLEQDYGSVEAGMAAMKQMYANVDYIGNEPPPGDTTVQRVDIPGIPFYMRLWTGMMDNSRTVCFHIMDAATDAPTRRPPELTIWIDEAEDAHWHSSGERCEMQPVEYYMLGPDAEVEVENFQAHDGDLIEFFVSGELVKTVRLPSRAYTGPSPPVMAGLPTQLSGNSSTPAATTVEAREARPLEVVFTKE
ncbi:uncharacterized protein SCHCODRAFT_02630428 [Schizophyllum commune H4-8]|uniref:Uncharacterized protein n=1 Tax=Schizophyllum commune (strain H4-8 / FGSC 9210) TaxID=578458 RepID=D8QAL8_SCHCM|nr:uncharacterized protein SCHCODRAFT_02630428 [Schizophyllum commune H4-8]KAI5889935.1 hypothetical protein SCHCODRAFT_02630428 [Schizophyllum commune H4-8]